MSHFTVLVVGSDVDRALAPFDENSDTDSPKWDWYQIGGRWTGRLKLKAGAMSGELGEQSLLDDGPPPDGSEYADSALVGDVDWDAMIEERLDAHRSVYQKVRPLVEGKSIQPWKSFMSKVLDKELTIEDAGQQYRGQELLRQITEAAGAQDAFFFSAEDLMEEVLSFDSADAYARYKGEAGASTYALLFEGDWIEPGEMGWFGSSSKTPATERDYTKRFWDIVRSLPDDERVTVVDCHI